MKTPINHSVYLIFYDTELTNNNCRWFDSLIEANDWIDRVNRQNKILSIKLIESKPEKWVKDY